MKPESAPCCCSALCDDVFDGPLAGEKVMFHLSPHTENWPHLQLRSQRSLLVDQLAAQDCGCLPPACLSPQAVSSSVGTSMWRVASSWWATPGHAMEAKPSDVCARVLPAGFK